MADLTINIFTSARKMIATLCCGLGLAIAGQAQADAYAVQVAAFATPSPAVAESYRQYGTVRVQRDANWSRVLIGTFADRDDAQLFLLELKREGFTDAFIRVLDSSAVVLDGNGDTEHSHAGTAPHRHMAEPDLQRLHKLSDEEKARAVYLDGELHLKEGERFIPLP